MLRIVFSSLRKCVCTSVDSWDGPLDRIGEGFELSPICGFVIQ